MSTYGFNFIVSSPLEGMDELSASEIEKMIGKLLGSYVPVCETNTDDKRFERQKVAEDVIWDMVEMMIEVAAYHDRPEYSANRAGKKALTFLVQEAERITEVLEDLLHDECLESIMNAEKFNHLWEAAECDSDSTTD